MPDATSLSREHDQLTTGATVYLSVMVFLLIYSFCPMSGIHAQPNPAERPEPSPRIIDSVEILTENVFDLSKPRYNNFLFRLANKAHVVTRHSVIMRELLTRKGEPYDTALVNESVRNLRHLPYLFKTEISQKTGRKGENIMVVNTSDRWTTTGAISFHRSGGRDDLQLELKEDNLLGYGISTTHDLFILEKERDYYQTELYDNRFLGKEISVNLFYSDNPRAGQISALLGRPFYSLRQKWGGELRFTRLLNRRDYYISEVLAAQERSIKDDIQLQVSYRIGSDKIKYHFAPLYMYTDLISKSRHVYVPEAEPLLPPPVEDSVIHYLQMTLRVEQINYAVYRNLNRFHKPEDINLGLDARMTFGAARRPGIEKIAYYYFSFWPQYILSTGAWLVMAGIQDEWWHNRDERLQRRLNCYFKAFGHHSHNQTFVFGARYSSHHLKEQSFTLYLDEDRGLRGYPAFSFNGEDRLVFNIENRFFSDLEVLSVGIGGVVFADIGNIWTRGSVPTLRNTEYAFGPGIRLGITRSSQAEVVRIDVAYAPNRKGFQISVGTGQFF